MLCSRDCWTPGPKIRDECSSTVAPNRQRRGSVCASHQEPLARRASVTRRRQTPQMGLLPSRLWPRSSHSSDRPAANIRSADAPWHAHAPRCSVRFLLSRCWAGSQVGLSWEVLRRPHVPSKCRHAASSVSARAFIGVDCRVDPAQPVVWVHRPPVGRGGRPDGMRQRSRRPRLRSGHATMSASVPTLSRIPIACEGRS